MDEKTECPVCGKSFPFPYISIHVNECLNNSEDFFVTEKRETKPQKRKSDPTSSNWGFLKNSDSSKKMKLSKGASSSESKPKQNEVRTENEDRGCESDDCLIEVAVTDENKTCASLKGLPSRENKSFKEFFNHQDSSETKKDLVSNKKRLFKNANSSNAQAQSKSFPPAKVFHGFAGVTSGGNANSTSESSNKKKFAPLAEKMRPSTLEGYVGQDKAVGKKSLLHSLLRTDRIPSMILWGPPGCGKTTLARIIANKCKSAGKTNFVHLSAAVVGVAQVKKVVDVAKNDQKLMKRKTILFLDEIHRFNKIQQDSLLPHVEDGTITLIGATTENPSFQVNSALLSRCRVIVLDKLSTEELSSILLKAIGELGGRVFELEEDIEEDSDDSPDFWLEKKAVRTLACLCDGDARSALNGLQMAVESMKVSLDDDSSEDKSDHTVVITTEHVKEGLQRSHVLYDRAGEEHYNIVSALQKSIRGSDDNAALYWLTRMLEGGENPLYIARRLVRIASEDIGLADPQALTLAVSAFQAAQFLGMPEADVNLAQCAVYLARAPKSPAVYLALREAKDCIRNHEGPLPSVPLHLRNASTKLMKDLGYGKGYEYGPSDQEYFPEELRGTDFFTWSPPQ